MVVSLVLKFELEELVEGKGIKNRNHTLEKNILKSPKTNCCKSQFIVLLHF